MPKFTVSKSALKRKWIAGEKDFSLEGETIFCKPCGKQFNFERKCQLEQHKKTTVHAANIQKQGNKRQRLLSECPPEMGERPSSFVNDLVAVMLQEAIPLQKLDKETPLRKFVEKYWESEAIPCVKTLRTKVAPATHFQVIEKIRDEIEDSPIWCSVDETTDRLGRNMVNVIVGKLSGKSASKGRLIHVAVVDKTNASMILQCVQEGLRILWKGAPGTTGRLKLFVTDCAAYMLKAGDHLKAMYPMVVHLTCFSHGFHRVAEAVWEEYPTVNKLISSTKKVFLKAPARVDLFRTMLPNTPLPPEPIITRWGTWLEAAQYYAENVSAIRCVFDSLDTNEAQAIRKAKEALAASELETHLHYISDNFGSLPSTIQKLQKQGMMFSKGVEEMQTLCDSDWAGTVGDRAKEKLTAVLSRNPGWKQAQAIAARLNGEECGDLPEGWTPQDISCMKYAPVTSADVERSFSKFKCLLTDKRTSLTVEHLEQHMVVFYNDFNNN